MKKKREGFSSRGCIALQVDHNNGNEETVAEIEAYFEAWGKLFLKNSIEMSNKRANECVSLG